MPLRASSAGYVLAYGGVGGTFISPIQASCARVYTSRERCVCFSWPPVPMSFVLSRKHTDLLCLPSMCLSMPSDVSPPCAFQCLPLSAFPICVTPTRSNAQIQKQIKNNSLTLCSARLLQGEYTRILDLSRVTVVFDDLQTLEKALASGISDYSLSDYSYMRHRWPVARSSI